MKLYAVAVCLLSFTLAKSNHGFLLSTTSKIKGSSRTFDVPPLRYAKDEGRGESGGKVIVVVGESTTKIYRNLKSSPKPPTVELSPQNPWHLERHKGRGRPRGRPGKPVSGNYNNPLVPKDPGSRYHGQTSEYLNAIEKNIEASEEVLIIGHGKGKGRAADVLMKDLTRSKPDLIPKVKVVKCDDTHLSDKQILKYGRALLLKRPDRRRKRVISGQEPFGE